MMCFSFMLFFLFQCCCFPALLQVLGHLRDAVASLCFEWHHSVSNQTETPRALSTLVKVCFCICFFGLVQQNERTIFSLRLLPTVGIYKTKSQPDPSDSTSIKSSSRACAWFSMCRCGRTNKAYDYGSVTVTSNSWYPESQLALALTSTHL